MRDEIANLLRECMRFAKRNNAQIMACPSRGIVHAAGKRFPRPMVQADGSERQDPKIVAELVDGLKSFAAEHPDRLRLAYEDDAGRLWFDVFKKRLQ